MTPENANYQACMRKMGDRFNAFYEVFRQSKSNDEIAEALRNLIEDRPQGVQV